VATVVAAVVAIVVAGVVDVVLAGEEEGAPEHAAANMAGKNNINIPVTICFLPIVVKPSFATFNFHCSPTITTFSPLT
jgi:hypothetical protein